MISTNILQILLQKKYSITDYMRVVKKDWGRLVLKIFPAIFPAGEYWDCSGILVVNRDTFKGLDFRRNALS